jgi:hypothetical protein
MLLLLGRIVGSNLTAGEEDVVKMVIKGESASHIYDFVGKSVADMM